MHLRDLRPRVVVSSDREPPSEPFREPLEAMDAERWMERDLAAGARALRYLDTDSRVNRRERHQRKTKPTRTLAIAPELRFQRSILPLSGIWGL